MKVIFKISILSNFVLLGILVVAFFNRPGIKPEGGPVTPPGMAAPVANPPAMAAPPPERAAPAPFRWSQLDNRDYHVYVKNLRAIGCPEPSVRAMVTADVTAVYGLRQRRLEEKLAILEGGSWSAQLGSAQAEQAIQAELQRMPGERTALIDDLLGRAPSRAAAPPVPAPVSLPLAMQTLDLTGLKLEPGQLEAMREVRQLFLGQTGGAAPDPNDAPAVQRWQHAQAEADDQLQAFLGSEVYQNIQLQAFANRQAGNSGPQ